MFHSRLIKKECWYMAGISLWQLYFIWIFKCFSKVFKTPLPRSYDVTAFSNKCKPSSNKKAYMGDIPPQWHAKIILSRWGFFCTSIIIAGFILVRKSNYRKVFTRCWHWKKWRKISKRCLKAGSHDLLFLKKSYTIKMPSIFDRFFSGFDISIFFSDIY